MLELKVLTDTDEVITYVYNNKEELIKEYNSDNIDMNVPSNDSIVLAVNGHNLFIDFNTYMYLIQ